MEDMLTSSQKNPDIGGAGPYVVPRTYYHPKVDEAAEKKKVKAAEGPAYSIGKSQRASLYHKNNYGKDHEPPHSYVELKQWIKKKEGGDKTTAEEKKKNFKRNTYIEAIFDYQTKYKAPGPGAYFDKGAAGKKEEGKKKGTGDNAKKNIPPTLNFLSDAEYLGLNNPAPGAYNLEVRKYWIE